MADNFARFVEGLNSPASDAFAVTSSDVDDLECVTRAIWVGGAGNLRVRMSGGRDVTFTNITGGTLLPLRVSRVFATDTTATELVGLQ